jgi:hypothetical protein
MDCEGLLFKYSVNRPLNAIETKYHLLPKASSLADKPDDHRAVIQMNSTYLEYVDKFYLWRGCFTVTVIAFLAFMLFMPISIISAFVQKWETLPGSDQWAEIIFLTGMLVTIIPILWLGRWLLYKEISRYTHYPIRFNCKTRMVHVFRIDGTVMSESWDKLYFTVAYSDKSWEIRGHRLADNGVTVLETFALTYKQSAIIPYLFQQWEFIRRYMEEGPKELIDQVVYTMDIAKHKETFWFGFHRMMMYFEVFAFFAWFFSPLLFVCAIGRWIVVQTSKIPVWPAEIEAECRVNRNDPYLRDEQHPHPSQVWVYPT